jgi:hypothetical protein
MHVIAYVARSTSALSAKKTSTSSRVGMDGCAPHRVTDMAATADAQVALSIGSLPCSIAAAKAPLNASPAPVVSIARTGNAGSSARDIRDAMVHVSSRTRWDRMLRLVH